MVLPAMTKVPSDQFRAPATLSSLVQLSESMMLRARVGGRKHFDQFETNVFLEKPGLGEAIKAKNRLQIFLHIHRILGHQP